MHIRSLTRRNTQGEVYRRTEEVEKQIRSALLLKPPAMLERAQIGAYKAPNYLQEECLVYMIREYKSRGERRVVEELSGIMIRRCSKYINEGVRNLRSEDKGDSERVDDAFSDVVKKLFDQILDLKSDRGDFLQVRFWPVVDKLRIGAFNQYLEDLHRAEEAVTWDSVAGYEGPSEEGEEQGNRKRRVSGSEPPQEAGLSAEQRTTGLDAVTEVLDRVDEPYRTAFVLRHYYDWPIETKDTSLPSISGYFEKTPRTIREWLRRAKEMVERWKGEKA